ncbi:CS1-pili formation C-terminal domain-containing protein [Salmonella enterica]|nr:hypothetical protein [Salmonella enterica]ECE2595318.1 hypothetical protein [Salmonella enterica]EFQ3077413.1 hypothetical protein [Salmonella enterica]EHH0569071.1 hypothetical protein [Salmonella enterica]EJC5178856.1 CS1-pili formation C-terminal domain-containing protein [Salmonella enterica]
MSRYFWMYYLLGLCSFTSQATLIPPPGFESLLEGQTEQIEVLLPGHSLGLFPVVVKPDTVQFMSPLMVLESSGLAALPVAERQKALAALSRPLLRNSNLVCGVSEAKDSSECGYVATDKEDVAVIFDENNGQLSLFLNRDWLPDEERRDKRWLTPTPEGVSAFIHRQTLYLSDDLHSRNMTLNGSGALGLGDGRYLGGNWAANSHQRNAGSASSLTAGYSSSLALSRNGLFWGGGQDGEPASGMAVNVESEGDEGSSGKVVSVRGSSQPFSLGFGQQSLLLMEGYNATEVTIEDAGVSSQGMAGVKAGGGSRRYFLTPGHLLVHNISASMSRLYVGRVLDKDGRPLLDAQPLNHPFLSLGPSGRFSLQSEHKESSLWLLSKNRILRCPMSVHKRRDVMQVVGDVRCELSDVDALPQALQISPRVIRLLNVAGLLRHAVQEA